VPEVLKDKIMFTAFRAAIKALLETRVGSGQPLTAVYDSHVTVFSEGYPAVTFEPSDMQSDYETTIQNLRTYVFRAMIHQEMENLDRSTAITRLLSIVDTLVADFDESDGLSGQADFVRAVPMEMGFYGEEGKLTMFAELRIVCVKSEYIV
jgi:hypothetical protein